MLIERIDRLSQETAEASELHQQEEVGSRKKKAKMEGELAAAVGKYDRDMAAKTAQISDIKARFSRIGASRAAVLRTYGRRFTFHPRQLPADVASQLRGAIVRTQYI